MEATRIQEIYEEITKYVIELESDPATMGPKYLNELVARCRNYLNRVSSILVEIGREKRDVSQNLRAREAAFQVSFDESLATDERVKKLPNIADRTATINMLLRDQRNEIEALKRELDDLGHIEKAVRHRHNELKATNTDIKMQRQMVRDELDTGSFYGDEGSGGRRMNPLRPMVDDIDESELDAIMKGNSIAGSVPQEEDPVLATPAEAPADTQETVEDDLVAACVEAVVKSEVASVKSEVASVKETVTLTLNKPTPSAEEVEINAFLSSPAAAQTRTEEEDVFANFSL